MNSLIEVEARETLKAKSRYTIDRDDLDQYLYYDDNLKVCFDEYITELFEETLDLDFPIGTENLKKLMKDNGVWIEYLNKYFEDFYHNYKMETDDEYNWKYEKEYGETHYNAWDDYCYNPARYV